MNTVLHTVRETEVDGVLCFFVDMGRPASAAHLLFRQGTADEALHETGWLHLLEHLALLDRETLTRPIEGRLSLLLTHFAAFGEPEAITERLGALGRWLSEPDLRLLARERGVLQSRAQGPRDGLVSSLTWRYGASGPGVTSYAEVGAVRADERPARRAVASRLQRLQRRPGARRSAARRALRAAALGRVPAGACRHSAAPCAAGCLPRRGRAHPERSGDPHPRGRLPAGHPRARRSTTGCVTTPVAPTASGRA